MDSQTIRTALGELQEDPDRKEAWQTLADAVRVPGGDLAVADALRLLGRARRTHASRGEFEAVGTLIAFETSIAAGTPDEFALVMEQARVLRDELFDEEGALLAHLRVLELSPNEPQATAAVSESEEKRTRYRELLQTYLDEASTAPDNVYKSSMLMRAAEMELRFAGEAGDVARVVERLEEALKLDPSNDCASNMLERLYRRTARFSDVGRILQGILVASSDPSRRATAAVRLARLLHLHLDDPSGAAKIYTQLLKEHPGQEEAVRFLANYYSRTDDWTALVALYERQLPESEHSKPERVGDMLQLGMLHWRKRDKPADAEPWFERIRRLDAGNPGMLGVLPRRGGEEPGLHAPPRHSSGGAAGSPRRTGETRAAPARWRGSPKAPRTRRRPSSNTRASSGRIRTTPMRVSAEGAVPEDRRATTRSSSSSGSSSSAPTVTAKGQRLEILREVAGRVSVVASRATRRWSRC